MIDVVGAVAPATTIQTPTAVDCADAQPAPIRPPIGLGVSNPLARVFGYFAPVLETFNGKAAFTLDRRFVNCQTWSEF